MNRSAAYASLLLLFAATPVWAQTTYTLTDMGTVGGQALGVNDSAQVVGVSANSGTNHAFVWSETAGLQDLATAIGYPYSSAANGINSSGQITGSFYYTSSGPPHAFLYSNGSAIDLGTLPGYTASVGYSVNSSGQVVGYSSSSSVNHAFLYSNGSMTDLGTLLGYTSSIARHINNNGQVVGYSTSSSVIHAFLYSNGSMTDLGTLGGAKSSFAFGINNLGEIVGDSSYSSTSSVLNAFLYSSGTMHDLGTPGISSVAEAINDNGQVVGAFTVPSGTQHAFLWTSSGGMQDLNSLLTGSPGWTLEVAWSINNNGWIAGYGLNPAGHTDAFLLTPGTASLNGSWKSAVSGNWGDATKWTGGVPNAQGASATFSAAALAPVTVTLDSPVTLGTLQLGNSASSSVGYTLSGSGANTLTFNNGGRGATIAVTDGAHAINAPVVLNDDLIVEAGGTSPWTLSFAAGGITDHGAGHYLTMDGDGGTLLLSGSNNYSGGTFVFGGTLVATGRYALPDGMSLTVGGSDTLLFLSPVAGGSAVPGQTSEPPATAGASGMSAVPEPGTLVLLAAASAAAAAWGCQGVGNRTREMMSKKRSGM